MKKAIQHLKKADPVLAAIIERVGPYKIEYREPIFQTLVRSIVYQQLNGKAALTIFNRLAAAAKADPLTPESILKLRPQRMRSLGLSQQKLTYIRELARLPNPARSISTLRHAGRRARDRALDARQRSRGVDRADVPDLRVAAAERAAHRGSRRSGGHRRKRYNLPDLPKPAEMERIAAPWHPHCSVAAWYLWRSLENQGAM